MAPNFAYERCAEQISEEQKAELDLSSLVVALNGAEPIWADTVQRFEKAFADCGFSGKATFPAYGLAEGTLITATSDVGGGAKIVTVDRNKLSDGYVKLLDDPTDANGLRLVSSGKTRHGQAIAIVDHNTHHRCKSAEVGELWLSGGSVAAGYWQNESATRDTFSAQIEGSSDTQCYMRTGDLAFELEGWFYIAGRLKDVIIIRGQNYYPQDIERIAQVSHPALKADGGAAFTVETDRDEKLILVQEVERTAMRRLDTDDVYRSIRRAVADEFDLKVHGVVLIRPVTLAKTSSGKIQRGKCKQLFETDALVEIHRDVFVATSDDGDNQSIKGMPGNAKLSEADVRGWLLSRLSNSLGITSSAIENDAPIADYGLDSSVAISLSSEIASWVGREQDSSLLWIYPSVNALSEHILKEFDQVQV